MPELIVKLEDIILQTCRFDGDLIRIGRSRENEVVLENLSVSRHHGQIRFHDGRFTLTDLNSANGIRVNGVRVAKIEIVDDDVITIGKHKIIFRGDPAESPTIIDDPAATRPPYKRKVAPAEAKSEAWVTVDSGRLKGREFRISKFETSFGKAPSNDVVLTDDWLLGKKQAIILRKGNDEFEIQDLGGLRKVKINGDAISGRAILQPGDVLDMGGTRLLFNMDGSVPKLSPTPVNGNPTPSEDSSEEIEVAPMLAQAAPFEQWAENESLDIEDFSGTMSLGVPPETPAGEQPSAGEKVDAAVSASARNEASAASSGAQKEAPEGRQRKGGRGKRHQRAAQKAAVSQAASASYQEPASPSEPEAANISEPAALPATDDKEVKIWEAALKSGSPAIRRQAARTLKKLTGRDYEA